VLPEAEEVGEPQVDRLDLLLTAQGEDFARLHRGASGGAVSVAVIIPMIPP
jgi:hypothetical protein